MRCLRALVATAAALVPGLAPGVAHACASCASTAYGDLRYNWAYLVLIALPFAVLGVAGTVIARWAGYRTPVAMCRAAWRRHRHDLDHAHKETT